MKTQTQEDPLMKRKRQTTDKMTRKLREADALEALAGVH